MEIIVGWVLTMGCTIGIISLPKEYVPMNVMGVVVGALLIQGAL